MMSKQLCNLTNLKTVMAKYTPVFQATGLAALAGYYYLHPEKLCEISPLDMFKHFGITLGTTMAVAVYLRWVKSKSPAVEKLEDDHIIQDTVKRCKGIFILGNIPALAEDAPLILSFIYPTPVVKIATGIACGLVRLCHHDEASAIAVGISTCLTLYCQKSLININMGTFIPMCISTIVINANTQ